MTVVSLAGSRFLIRARRIVAGDIAAGVNMGKASATGTAGLGGGINEDTIL